MIKRKLWSQVAWDMLEGGQAPELWSAEEPNLYVLVLSLLDEAGGLIESESCQVPPSCKWRILVVTSLKTPAPHAQVGFRKSEVKGHQLLVNNRAILIKGVCRHEHDERRGKAVTEELMLRDIALMKQLNFNAVRCSHYPNHNRWCGSVDPPLCSCILSHKFPHHLQV